MDCTSVVVAAVAEDDADQTWPSSVRSASAFASAVVAFASALAVAAVMPSGQVDLFASLADAAVAVMVDFVESFVAVVESEAVFGSFPETYL